MDAFSTAASYPALGEVLARAARHNAGRPAILDPSGSLDWRSFLDRVARAAGWLRARGLVPGDRFAILARNGPRLEILKCAGHWSGIVPVPVNWRFASPEIVHVLSDADCRLVMVEDEFAPVFETGPLAGWAPLASPLSDAWDHAVAGEVPAPPAAPDPRDDAIVLYTGGTTGRSKGVRLSHAAIVANGLAFGLAIGARRDDVYLHAAPMFHSADLLGTAWFLQGAAHAYLPAFTPAAFLDTIARHRITATVTVPAMLVALLGHPGLAEADVSSLRILVYGAAPMALERIREVAHAFPNVAFSNSYGLTETSPDLTVFDPREFRAAIDAGDPEGPVRSVGKPNILNALRVVDPDGVDLPPGEAGELWARGPNIMTGYLNLPEVDAETLVDGWLRTGDVARIDENGYVYLLDRLKDLVISGGENVYTSEVEAALHAHPGVAEAAVIGVPDDRMGEALMAVIVPAGEPPAPEALVAHCRPLIAGYKIPRRFAFAETLPRSALGKVLKSELRRAHAEVADDGTGVDFPAAAIPVSGKAGAS